VQFDQTGRDITEDRHGFVCRDSTATPKKPCERLLPAFLDQDQIVAYASHVQCLDEVWGVEPTQLLADVSLTIKQPRRKLKDAGENLHRYPRVVAGLALEYATRTTWVVLVETFLVVVRPMAPRLTDEAPYPHAGRIGIL
jgi:hypothetical protein